MTISRTLLDTDDCVHIINPLALASGGSEHHAASLFQDIGKRHRAVLWSTGTPDPAFGHAERIDPQRRHFPRRGTFIFVGHYFNVGRWYFKTRPRRVVLLNNTWNYPRLLRSFLQLSLLGLRRVQIVHVGAWMLRKSRLPGAVQFSRIDPGRFTAAAETQRKPGAPFHVGRLSRDAPLKHHDDDPMLYRSLAESGCRVSIMGGTCLGSHLDGPGIDLFRACAIPVEEFLGGLDCFVYRTSSSWREPFGRVVAEAMSCGLPVVCHAGGGYADIIDHGRDGFLFRTTSEAREIILGLKADRALARSVGRAAREKMLTVFSEQHRQACADWYAGRPSLRQPIYAL